MRWDFNLGQDSIASLCWAVDFCAVKIVKSQHDEQDWIGWYGTVRWDVIFVRCTAMNCIVLYSVGGRRNAEEYLECLFLQNANKVNSKTALWIAPLFCRNRKLRIVWNNNLSLQRSFWIPQPQAGYYGVTITSVFTPTRHGVSPGFGVDPLESIKSNLNPLVEIILRNNFDSFDSFFARWERN